mgnify:CR=1 FL=1
MKSILGLLIFLSNLTYAQTTVEGRFSSFTNTKYTIKLGESSLNDFKGKTIIEGKTDNEGEFLEVLNITHEQSLNLYIGNTFFKLWVKPHSVSGIQSNDKPKYSFFGGTAIENKILFESGIMQPFSVPKNIGLEVFAPKKQILYLDSIASKRLEILRNSINNQIVSEMFQSFYISEVQNFTHYNLSQYTKLLEVSGKISDNAISDDYFDFWDTFSLANDNQESNSYQSALQDFIEYIALKKVGKSQIGTEKAWNEMFRVADSLLRDKPLTLQKQKTNFLLLLIKYFNFEELTKSEFSIFRNQFPESESLPLLSNLLEKKYNLSSQQIDFQLKDANGDFVEVKNFRGNVVYIDFWGAWCKACLVNMPHAKKLKKKFENESVVFLYINFYDTEEKWINAIDKFDIEGVHLKAEKSDEEYFNNIFQIGQGFPRYALLDKEGKLITSSAPQPQDKAAFELIQKYLIK